MLANLLSNAWRHGGEDAKVVLSVEQTDGHTVVTVVDDGPGVSAQVLEGLGRRTERTERTDRSRSGDGLGLGLALSNELASQMGASLRFMSPPAGQQSGFAAMLALHRAAPPERPAPPLSDL